MRTWFLVIFFCLPAWTTTFSMQSLDQQIQEADGIFIGHYLKSRSVRLESGSVATQMIFKVQKEWGLQSDLYGLEEVIVHFPGGKLDELHVEVQGVPQFVVGEKVALFTRNVDNRYWGHNLGLGAFKIVSYGQDTMLVNTLFPEDPRVGQIKLDKFEYKVKQIKKTGFKLVRQLKASIPGDERRSDSLEEGQKRSIASTIDQADNTEDQSGLSVYWLLAALALIGGMTRLIRARDA